MLVGVPKEIKNFEFRVGLIPASVRELIAHGHQVLVQKNAGEKIGFDDAAYQQVGAKIVDTADEIFSKADMIVKVNQVAADFRRVSNKQMADTTKRTIRENVSINAQLQKMS